MSVLGTLTASTTTTFRLPYVPEFICIDSVDADLVIDSLSVSVQGGNPQSVADQDILQAVSKYLNAGILGADVKVGQSIKIADGEIQLPQGQQFVITLGNSGATTPTVYAQSTSVGTRVFTANESSVNSSSFTSISGISALFFEGTNFSKATITYSDGHEESDLSLVELAFLNVMNPNTRATDADGKLAGVNVIDFVGLGVQSVKLYATSGGNLPYAELTL